MNNIGNIFESLREMTIYRHIRQNSLGHAVVKTVVKNVGVKTVQNNSNCCGTPVHETRQKLYTVCMHILFNPGKYKTSQI